MAEYNQFNQAMAWHTKPLRVGVGLSQMNAPNRYTHIFS